MALGCLGTRGVVASLLATFMCVPAAAQAAQEDQPIRPVSRTQGEAVVQAAWELRKGLGEKPDCSHFVHAVYQQAGLEYEYANSHELFEGIAQFRRVQKPQPGDLIVWKGHVGIVIDPDEHSFYSSVLKGYAIEDYRSHYWAHRGHPRFYRYLLDETQSAQLRVHQELSQAAVNSGPRSIRVVPAVVHDDADSPDHTSPPDKTTSAISANQPNQQTTSTDAEILDAVFVSPRSRPLKTEVRAALIRMAGAKGERILRTGPLNSQTVDIADEFVVEELNIHDRSGWAVVAITGTASIENGTAHLQRRRSTWHLALSRQAQGWMMFVPRDAACLPRDQAIKALFAHLAQLSRDAGNANELRRTMKVLDDLRASGTRYTPPESSD
jgi:hypothetical protein